MFPFRENIKTDTNFTTAMDTYKINVTITF